MSDSWPAEREQMKEGKVAMAIELAASRSDKELIKALHHRLRVEEDQRFNLVKTTRKVILKSVCSAFCLTLASTGMSTTKPLQSYHLRSELFTLS